MAKWTASRSIRATLGAAAGLCLLALAGCGGSSGADVAHLSARAASSSASGEAGGGAAESKAGAQAKLVAYAKCMRANGVPAFPEPVEGGIELHAGPGTSLNPESAQFKAAERQCHKLMPEGAKPSPQRLKQAEEQALKFSACMRSHGEPNFPEPEFQGGGVRLRLKAGAGGIEPRSPQFQAAQKACEQYFGGPRAGGGLLAAPGGGGPPAGSGGAGASEATQQAAP